MAIASTVLTYLQRNKIRYDIVAHPRTERSRDSAAISHVPADRMAKAVVLNDPRGYLMAVVPSDRHVKVDRLSKRFGRTFELASEDRIAPVFKDCDVGAIPPIGTAYGMETILDDSLVGLPEVYFEAGDHEELIRVDGDSFVRLLKDALHGQFSH